MPSSIKNALGLAAVLAAYLLAAHWDAEDQAAQPPSLASATNPASARPSTRTAIATNSGDRHAQR